jgi:ribosome-binding protein aMBF1 (putative translation factor)
MYYEKERPANVKSLIISLTNEQKWNPLPLNTFNAEARSLSNTEQSLEQIMDLAVQFQGKTKMQQLVSTSAERMKAQNKVKLAIDSCNNPRLRETQKYWLFFTSLAEACECVRDENREFWDTSWARNKYKKISELAESYAQQLREFRDKRGWSVYHW